MAKMELDERALLTDTRMVVANGKRYHFKTAIACTTCAIPDRFMYLKQKLQGGVTLECPVCDSLAYAQANTISESK